MESRRYYLITPLAYTGAATAFTYHAEQPLGPGTIVEVPIGRRQITGVVLEESSKPSFATKPIAGVVDAPPLPPDLISLAAWLTSYYAASPSSVFSTLLPAGLTKQRRSKEEPLSSPGTGLPPQPLTSEQTAALKRIRTSNLTSHLLQGVTGSGKTRLYLELTAEALANGQSVIILVPEITLTPQIVGQFEAAFGSRVLASHSKLTEAQRHLIWSQASTAAAAGEPRIIIGPRSCLFMPAHKLGLIVVDECHESTYKQEQHPRYNAVSAAAKRAHLTSARLVLGSATPGLGELFLAQQAGRQALLYLNRRGSASSQVCGDCGHVTTCPNCSLPLTFHADLMRLICHHCNYRTPNPAVCPECNGADLKLLGGGTKRIEAEVIRLFPDARVARLDRDSATLSHIKTVFRALQKGELDIVIGTQMIAKGLDLPAIDTVGVVNADTMLFLPDFTAAERTFQLLSQVSGRAGRGDRPGQIYIQTYSPTHPAIVAAATGSYDRFAASELEERQALSYPPYVYLLHLSVAATNQAVAQQEAAAFAAQIKQRPGLAVIGPAPSFIEQQGKKYVWTITVKSKHRAGLVAVASALPGDHWSADLDPANLL
ncbi:MAG: primosome assembly protein PriA [Candidatus Saccharibacteria bacterium]|nr:primosome assembly protein PriA [Candidatus Saccharibacteria bacterium]